jgi:nucleoid-associated protein YgaU
MGFFSFVKSAGEMLGISGGDAPSAESLRDNVTGLGLMAESLDVSIEGDTVTVSGNANSQEEREKIVLALGNVTGVSWVKESIEAAQSVPEASFYTVCRGDTLWKIASACYGDGNKYPVIFEANRPMLSHPDKIYPGQVLRIPPLE